MSQFRFGGFQLPDINGMFAARVKAIFADINLDESPLAKGIESHSDSVVDLVDRLVHAAAELEKQLARLIAGQNKKSNGGVRPASGKAAPGSKLEGSNSWDSGTSANGDTSYVPIGVTNQAPTALSTPLLPGSTRSM
jgi:hypothetical protein